LRSVAAPPVKTDFNRPAVRVAPESSNLVARVSRWLLTLG
jgi:hypothetical protein